MNTSEQLMRRYDKYTTGVVDPPIQPDEISAHLLAERREKWLQHPCTAAFFDFVNAEIAETNRRIDALALLVDSGPQIHLFSVKLKTLKELNDYGQRV